MLAALAEDLAARRLASQPVPFDELLRAEGCAKRAIRSVLAERPILPPSSPPPGLRYARARWAAQEALKAKGAVTASTESPPDGRTD
jgi:hypothetical protein